MKEAFTSFSRQTANLLPLSFLIGLSRQKLFLPYYHAIKGKNPLPHIHHLYDLRSQKTFEADLDFLLKHFQAIGLPEILEIAKGKLKLKKPSFFLSFDDGLREVYDFAIPVLRRKGVPATLFLNADFVDNKDLFFRYKVSLLIEKLKTGRISDSALNAVAEDLDIQSSGVEPICSALLNIDYLNKDILDKIADLIDVSFIDFLKEQQPYLNSSQILSLQKEGFTFGSHSLDHPLYHQLPVEQQLQQTSNSLQFVQETFNPTIRSFAFPFTDYGVKNNFFEAIAQQDLLDLSFGCAGLKKEQFSFHFQRFGMEGNDYTANKLVAGEYFTYIAKALIGKHRISR